MSRMLAASLSTLGLFLLASSWLAPAWIGGRRDWTDAQASELARSSADLHSLTYELVEADRLRARQSNAGTGKSPDFRPTEEDLNAARQRYEIRQAALQKARTRGAQISDILRWSGIGVIVLAVVCYAVSNARKQ